LIQQYVIKFINELRQVGGFLRALVSSANKTDCQDITEILLKVVLSTITLTLTLDNVHILIPTLVSIIKSF